MKQFLIKHKKLIVNFACVTFVILGALAFYSLIAFILGSIYHQSFNWVTWESIIWWLGVFALAVYTINPFEIFNNSQ